MTSTNAELIGLARGAHLAGLRGDCVGARTLAARIKRLDPDFHATVILTDSAITDCVPKPRLYAEPPAPVRVPQPAAPVTDYGPPDTGRNVAGQFLVGSVMTFGVGGLALLVAIKSNDEATAIGLTMSGVVLGSSAGVILMGDNEATDYSLAATVVGSAGGALIALAAANDADSPEALIAWAVIAPTLGAMAGFNISRKPIAPRYEPNVAIPVPRISNNTTTLPLLAGAF